jgi:hypothetical protein
VGGASGLRESVAVFKVGGAHGGVQTAFDVADFGDMSHAVPA